MRRWWFWTALAGAVVALAAGTTVAYSAYRDASEPAAAVRGYFAALARADAPAALGYGPVPPGSHRLLTSAVLAQQQRIAPLRDVRILGTAQNGAHATVRYAYRLAFAAAARTVTGRVALRRTDGRWRLTATAVATTLEIDQARDRIIVGGAAPPDGPTAVFPGAVPVRFDTPYLRLAPHTSAVRLGAGGSAVLEVRPSAGAVTTLRAQLQRLLRRCVSAGAAPAGCPLPPGRVVPGSLSGTFTGVPEVAVRVGARAAGELTLTGAVHFTGSYRRLDFDNVAHRETGALSLPVRAVALAVAPLRLRLDDRS
jgi:hypothetical protein